VPAAALSRVDQWIYDTLTADGALAAWATGGIWSESAPQGTTGNLVIFAWQGGSHRKPAMSYSLFLVRAVAEGESFAAVEDAADRIDTQLMTTIPVGGLLYRGVRLFPVQRDQPHQRKDAENGVPVVYLGNVYRFWFSSPA
jgi:hypothetical protein